MEIKLSAKEHQIVKKHQSHGLSLLFLGAPINKSAVYHNHRDPIVPQLLKHLVESVVVLCAHQVQILCKMADILGILEFPKLVFEEINFSFVVVNKEFHGVPAIDHALQLGLLVGCQGDHVEIVFVHDVHAIHDLG